MHKTISSIEYEPGADLEDWPEVRHAAAIHAHEQRQQASRKRVSAVFATIHTPPQMPGALDWIAVLPKALRKQIRDLHNGKVIPAAAKGMAALQQQFRDDEIHLAILDDDGLLALAAAQAAAARAADGYGWNEPPGRPEHDRRINMKRLRERRREVIACLEIATKVTGGDEGQSPYSGSETRRIRKGTIDRTADYLQRAKLIIPERDSSGRIVGEKFIALSEAGNTRYKGYSEFLGFVGAIQELADKEGRRKMMVTTSVPAQMQPSSSFYDGYTTPRLANRWLAKNNKNARDYLSKLGVKCAGVQTTEPTKKSIPHKHSAIAHTAREVAEQRYDELISSLAKIKIMLPLELGKKRRKSIMIDVAEEELLDGMTKEEFIDGMMRDMIECAYNRYFLDETENGRDDGTGRLVIRDDGGVGVNIKHDAGDNGAAFTSYVTTYIIKSFAVDYDTLPSKPERADYATDDDWKDALEVHKQAICDMVQQQVEAGGDIAISAWSSAHGIRTRELFGIPSRSPWRSLGKVRDKIADRKLERMKTIILIGKVNNKRKVSAHSTYLRAQGGLNAPRRQAQFRIQREVLPSNYVLRQDMIRRRVLGVSRFEQTLPPQPGTFNMHPAVSHRTRIEGCRIVIGAVSTPAGETENGHKWVSRALVPNFPRGVLRAPDCGTTSPPITQKMLH